MTTRITRILRTASPVALLAATIGVAGCSTATTDTAETSSAAAPATVTVGDDEVTLPDGAWDAATTAADQCDQATAETIVGSIGVLSGYDGNYTDDSGREGYAALAPEQWKQWGTDDPADRNDLSAATTAVGNQLCHGYDVAGDLTDDPADDFEVESLALAVTLMGNDYVQREGIPPVGEHNDPFLVRAQVSDIQHAAESVTA